jgi:murein DD-endopeptidase MepM/ murein hydrolase activator NlpD
MRNPYDPALITDDDAAHRARTPPSAGGDDFAYGYGSPILSPGPGVVDLVDHDNGGSGGRMVGVRHAGGVRSEQLHASRLDVHVGQEVDELEPLGLSGASAYGSDWGTDGAHIHAHFYVDGVRVGWMNYLASIDASSPVGGDRQPITNEEDEEMAASVVIQQVAGTGKNTLWHLPDDNTEPTPIVDMDELRSLIATGAVRKVNPGAASVEMQHIIVPANDVILERRRRLAARKTA